MFGLTTTRRLRAEVAAARETSYRFRDERNAAREEASAYKAAAKTAASQYLEADEKYVDACIVNELLTTDLTAAREKLAEYSGRRTVAEVLEEHDAHRKALADALGEQKRHLGWDALIGEVGGLAGSVADLTTRLDAAASEPTVGEWRGRARRAEKRADHLQKELDNAVGLPPGGPLSSAMWQPGYQDPKSTPKAAS